MAAGTVVTTIVPGYELEVLDHGVRLITAPLGQRNSASVALMFKIGSRYEPERIAGVSHFVEHMVFKGSRRYPTSKDVAEAIEGVGGELNAATDKETTVYWARVPGDKLANAIDVLTDIVQNPVLDPEEVEKERDVILEELRMYLDSPATTSTRCSRRSSGRTIRWASTSPAPRRACVRSPLRTCGATSMSTTLGRTW